MDIASKITNGYIKWCEATRVILIIIKKKSTTKSEKKVL